MTNLLIRVKTIENLSSEPLVQEKLAGIQNIVSQTIDQIRDLSYSLRPPALEEFGLGAAVLALAEELTRQTHIKIQCNCQLDKKISTEVETVLYRIAQEGLTNVIRHAEASRVTIELEERPHTYYLKIEDDGIGFDPSNIPVDKEKRHLGLIGMNERAELIGGRLEVYSTLEAGTIIVVNVPILQKEKTHAG